MSARARATEASGAGERLPVSAIVVSRNEAAELARCLATLDFCAEILIIDLESNDDTASVAASYGARVLRRPLVPSVERARFGVVAEARHDWLLFTDPDEELPAALARQVAEHLSSGDPQVAVVFAPIQYRFGDRPLRGTVWGGLKERRLLVHSHRVELTPVIYSGVRLRPGFTTASLPYIGDNAIDHHWVSGYRDLVRKHRRYARLAGEDREAVGETTGYRRIVRLPVESFVESFVRKQGYRDGFTGLALSLFWAWFTTASELALKRSLDARAAG